MDKVWEQVGSGPVETYRMEVPGGWLYHVIVYEERMVKDRWTWIPVTSSLCFVGDA